MKQRNRGMMAERKTEYKKEGMKRRIERWKEIRKAITTKMSQSLAPEKKTE
jgi:hypothetical protein